jgi:hypothetical protein
MIQAHASHGAARRSGLLMLGLLVLLGFLPAAYYFYKRPRLERERAAALAAAPNTLSARLEQWKRFGDPMIHRRLAVVGRFSADKPWLVTHVIRAEGGGFDFFGVPADLLPNEITRLEGSTIVLELPAPRWLGRGTMQGDSGAYVPIVEASLDAQAAQRSAEERLVSLALFLLEDLPARLERDIAGARLEVRVAEAEGR